MSQPRDKDGKFARKWGGFVVAGGVGLAIAVGGGAGGAGVGAGAGSATGAQSTLSEQASVSIRSTRTAGQKSSRTRARLALRNPSARATGQADTRDCADLATGAVREYLLAHRCLALQRGTFSVSSGRDRAVVAVAWIEMGTDEDAEGLKEVLDSPGTGSIRPLDRRVTLTGQRYASDIDGTVVTTAEAEPVAGSVATKAFEEAAEQAAG